MQQSIICPKCSSPNALGQRFCWNCGTTLTSGCPNCGAPLDPGSRFCGNCGAQLPPTPSQQPGGWGQPPPQQPGGWGQPPPPSQQPGGWGQPPPPRQQPGGWGQPPPPPQQPGGWGPQTGAWGPPRRAGSGSGGLWILLFVLLIGLGAFSYVAFFSDLLGTKGSSGTSTASAITTGPFFMEKTIDEAAGKATMEIRWTTKDLYKGQVEYGTDTSYGSTSVLESDFVTNHVVVLDLKTSTSYNYRIILKNNKDNKEWKSDNYTGKTRTPATQ